MQIQRTLRFHFTLAGMVKVNNKTTTNAGVSTGREDPPSLLGGCKLLCCYVINVEKSPKVKNKYTL